MISIKIDIKSIDNLQEAVRCLDQAKDLIQSSYSDQDFSCEIDTSSLTAQLSLQLLSDKKEKFYASKIDSCCD
jgi:hypothetical protein